MFDWTLMRQLIWAKASVLSASGGGTWSPAPAIINMYDFFWANGSGILSAKCNGDTQAEEFYLIVSGSKDDTTVTIEVNSPLTLEDLYAKTNAGVIEYNDGSVDLVSLYVLDGALTIYPPLKQNISSAKIYSSFVSIHLTKAAYKYYTNSFFNINRKYTRKKTAIAQFNPYASVTPNPLTKIGSFWWGLGVENVKNDNYRVVDHCTQKYLNMSMITGATEQSPKGFEWSVSLEGKTGYFEMYLGGRDTDSKTGEFADGLEFNLEFYLDGVLQETRVKKQKKVEAIRFDFSGAQTGKVRMFTTSGASTYAAHLTQATWWETDETDGPVFDSKKTPLLFMDSWGVYKDNEVQNELSALLIESGKSGIVINKSSGGQTSAWGIANFDDLVLPEHPGYMITDFQINDINTGITQEEYIANMTALINSAVEGNIKPVVLLSAHATDGGDYSMYTFPLITSLTEIPEQA